jgi:GNAT superfamily N-acetyltransferase
MMINMAWHITQDVDDLLTAAGEGLRAQPVLNTVLLTTLAGLRQNPPAAGERPPMLGWADDGGCFVRIPPQPITLSAMPAATAAELCVLLIGSDLPGVTGPEETVRTFGGEWQRLIGQRVEIKEHQALMRLGELVPPTPATGGRARVAGPGDREPLIVWLTAFMRDVGEDTEQVPAFIDDKIAYGGMHLWEVDGVPVSMAGRWRPEAGVARVMAVYTPKEHRGKGYAGAVTAAVSQAALADGATEVVLLADTANPTSTGLYQRLGFSPVGDRVIAAFS